MKVILIYKQQSGLALWQSRAVRDYPSSRTLRAWATLAGLDDDIPEAEGIATVKSVLTVPADLD